jgi:hypothetical protein
VLTLPLFALLLERLSGKCPAVALVTYALRYGEQEVSYRSVRRLIALHQSSHLPGPTGQGRSRLHGLRVILDDVFYVLKSGCP